MHEHYDMYMEEEQDYDEFICFWLRAIQQQSDQNDICTANFNEFQDFVMMMTQNEMYSMETLDCSMSEINYWKYTNCC